MIHSFVINYHLGYTYVAFCNTIKKAILIIILYYLHARSLCWTVPWRAPLRREIHSESIPIFLFFWLKLSTQVKQIFSSNVKKFRKQHIFANNHMVIMIHRYFLFWQMHYRFKRYFISKIRNIIPMVIIRIIF